MEKITLNAEFLFEFANKGQWILNAQKWFKNTGLNTNDQKLICVDANGFTLTTGADFSAAETLKVYPVKVYRLVRTMNVFYGTITPCLH